jgi:hypothetical protein
MQILYQSQKEPSSSRVQAGAEMNGCLPQSHVSVLLISLKALSSPAKCYRNLHHFPLWEQPFPHHCSFQFNTFKYYFKSRMTYTDNYDFADSRAGMRPAVCQPSWSDILTVEAYPLVISQGQTSLFTVGISTSHQLVQVYSTC